jgi:hypothetical protein
MHRLSALLLVLMSSAAIAQTTGTLSPTASPDASAKEDVPAGSCMPIGMTASGEMVFPIQCKGIIERERGRPAEQKTAIPDNNATAKTDAPTISHPAIKPVETVPIPERRNAATSVDGDDCKHFRTYSRASGTYRDYDGRRRPCR